MRLGDELRAPDYCFGNVLPSTLIYYKYAIQTKVYNKTKINDK